MILQYQKSQTDPFFRFCYLFNVRSKNYRLHEVKANVGHRSSNLEQKVDYLFHPVYTIDI